MRYVFVFTLVCFILLSFSPGICGEQKDFCDSVNDELLKKHIVIPEYNIVQKKTVNDSLCEIVLKIGDDYVPVYASKDYVIVGDFFTGRQHVTLETLSELQRKDFQQYRKELDNAVAFSYSPQNSGKYIYFITDPDCAYCENAKTPIKEFAESNAVEIKVVFFPLPMHQGASDKVIKGICGKMTFSDYLENRFQGDLCDEGREKVASSIGILEKLKIRGTPTFISADGRKIEGFFPDNLKELL